MFPMTYDCFLFSFNEFFIYWTDSNKSVRKWEHFLFVFDVIAT